MSLAFEPDHLSGIMGPNGAGKTTFFNTLTGLYKPTTGKIRFNGRDRMFGLLLVAIIVAGFKKLHMHSQRCRSHLVSELRVVDRLVGMHQRQLALRLSSLQAVMGLRGLVPGIGFGDIGINASTGD